LRVEVEKTTDTMNKLDAPLKAEKLSDNYDQSKIAIRWIRD